jgi:hypothetical protein
LDGREVSLRPWSHSPIPNPSTAPQFTIDHLWPGWWLMDQGWGWGSRGRASSPPIQAHIESQGLMRGHVGASAASVEGGCCNKHKSDTTTTAAALVLPSMLHHDAPSVICQSRGREAGVKGGKRKGQRRTHKRQAQVRTEQQNRTKVSSESVTGASF